MLLWLDLQLINLGHPGAFWH